MSWRDNLRPASFRGVPFFVESLDNEPGRRVEVIRFPGREDVVGQDSGLDAMEGAITAFVIGDEYQLDRDALEAALLTEGPGVLVHPTRGELTVIVHGKPKWHEDPKKKGGFATVSFAYTVSQPVQSRFTSPNGDAAMVFVAEEAIETASDSFVADLSTEGLPSSVVASQVEYVQSLSETLANAMNTIATIVDDVSEVVSIVDQLENDAEALLAAPATLAEAVGDAFALLMEDAADLITSPARIGSKDFDATTIGFRKKIIRTVQRAVDQLLANGLSTEIDTSTPTLETETRNLRAIDALFRATAIASFGKVVVDLPWTSYQEAAAAQERVVEWIQDVEAYVPDDVYQSLQDLRVAIATWLASVASSLPYLRTYSPPETSCAILIAHQLYGDATRESEIVGRNDPSNPAAVPSSLSLEVASA